MKRVFLIVLDSFGVGEAPDAADFGDAGSDTMAACWRTGQMATPNMAKLGLFNIDHVHGGEPVAAPLGAFGKCREVSKGKDTTTGHWEIAGLPTEKALPTYPDGFPAEIIEEYEKLTGHKILCNKPYSGTKVIADYGEEARRDKALIVYTSADSVFQVAAHEGSVPVEELYRCCKIARELMTGVHGVGRIIARPFIGEKGDYRRTANRHDFSIEPPGETMLDLLSRAGKDVLSVGKIVDIFAGRGISEIFRTKTNAEGIEKTIQLTQKSFDGLCFVNLVDFDMVYGHRNDAVGYAKALAYFDEKLPDIMAGLRGGDLLMITADHGCDPSTPSTDHSREYVPWLIYGKPVRAGVNLGTLPTFADISQTILDYFSAGPGAYGESRLPSIL